MNSVSRRKFIQSFAGAVASVSIGMKLSQGMPTVYLPSRLHHEDELGEVVINSYRFRYGRADQGCILREPPRIVTMDCVA